MSERKTDLISDPGLAKEAEQVGILNRYMTDYVMPSIIDESNTASYRGTCATDCVFATHCEDARNIAFNRYVNTGVGVSWEFDNPYDRTRALESVQGSYDTANEAIDAFEAAVPNCPGPEITTVETTYEPFDYETAALLRFGRLRQFAMRLRGENSVVLSRNIVSCQNPAKQPVIDNMLGF